MSSSFPYASSVSSDSNADEAADHRPPHHRPQIRHRRHSRKPSRQEGEVWVTFEGRRYALAGLSWDTTCRDAVFALLWHLDRRKIDDRQAAAPPPAAAWKAASDYELLAELPNGRAKRARAHLPLLRVADLLRRRWVGIVGTSPPLLQIRPRRSRQASEAAAAPSVADNIEGDIIGDWMRRLNLLARRPEADVADAAAAPAFSEAGDSGFGTETECSSDLVFYATLV